MTGVQTCTLPIWLAALGEAQLIAALMELLPAATAARALEQLALYSHLPPVRQHLPPQQQFFERAGGTEGGHFRTVRAEERRVGKEWR